VTNEKSPESVASRASWGDDQTKFFFSLTPDRVLAAVESAGFLCTGRCMALNSFENRVYDVELETDERPMTPSENHRVAKFYRPGRWNEDQILEEHRFIKDLIDAEIPAIAPLEFPEGGTLRKAPDSGIFYTLFPKVGGRAPDELTPDQLRWVGRLLARIHTVGGMREAKHRVQIGPDSYGRANLEFLLAKNWLPMDYLARYRDAANAIFAECDTLFLQFSNIRLHGDCHLGNLLWNKDGPFFLDFDDMVRGPAVQDLWLLMPGRDEIARASLNHLIEGYDEIRIFDRASLRLIEPLRALRLIHYAAWIARRWEDPAFPQAFPEFNSHRYWNDQAQDLEEQLRQIRQ